MKRPARLSIAAATLFIAACARTAQVGSVALAPQSAVDELLAADRAFSEASARTDLITGLAAMFAPDVAMPVPGRWVEGAPAVIEALRANPANAQSRLEWTPIRGGISADGQQGFTFGYMTLRRPDSTSAPMKYLAYWVKGPGGWRVAVYRRRPRPEGAVSLGAMAPSLPVRMVAFDPSGTGRFGESLAESERSFSRDAQRIGLGPAFAQYGRADAVNMGGATDTTFVFGAEAIARGVPAGSSVSWGPNRVIVASSGDLGVTIGMIYPNQRPADGSQPAGFPFFTVWRRSGPAAPWRYIAE
jgi:ketosteroid isomerase-like protein